MKRILFLFLTLSTLYSHAQQNDKFNLGFEEKKTNAALATGWFKWGTYNLTIDSLSHSGNLAAKITSDEASGSFGSIAYSIPANYSGKTIKLEGYMKIRDVEGFAGLLLRIDGDGKSLVFDNMQNQRVKGTKDWQKYSVTLDYPEDGELILVAGMLSGKGEAWFDDFVVTIDGQDVQMLKEKQLPKPQTDKEFDNGSLVELQELSAQQLDDLELLGKIWGFLKYHHPEIAKGNYNWDYELFRFVPSYIANKGKVERDELLVRWIGSLGEVKTCQNCATSNDNAFLKTDLGWIDKQDESLRNALQHIYKNRGLGKNYYVAMNRGVGNPDFKNENPYTATSYPDDGFRLLSLFRYWNIINYFFPYRHLTDKNWDTTLREYLPLFVQAKDELAYELAVLQIIAEVNDTHAGLGQGADKIATWKGTYYPTFQTRFIEDKLTVTDFYYPELQESTGLAVGDVIHSIDGKKTDDIIAERTPYYPASNKPVQLRNMTYDLLRSNKESIEIEFTSASGLKQTKTLALYSSESLRTFNWINPKPPESFKMLDDNIGYITLQTIKDDDIPLIKENFKDAKGIIIDIRNYPSANVPFSLGSYFVSSPTAFVKFTGSSVSNPGEFVFRKGVDITPGDKNYAGPVVVIVNEISQSAAEYAAMSLRAGQNTTVIGSTTAGADGNVSTIHLPGGLQTKISGIGIYYPDGKETQRVGIIPDIEVKPTIEGIRSGKDELLEQAIEFIKRQ
ncbi:peptidase S41 [Sphingobacterium olei]|uniref:Peptidase S41 n=1 Tax=Sphingobacterium olei TaxID=2571155 RepID=A0A4U0P780_9SPHI|nr:S41 family peptidase [Sphingobacterium olei]TJZ63325.1 peptidase S41 [Sphingobacterium olei]